MQFEMHVNKYPANINIDAEECLSQKQIRHNQCIYICGYRYCRDDVQPVKLMDNWITACWPTTRKRKREG